MKYEYLRNANVARVGQFRNRHGDKAHAQSDGSDWSPNDWMVATMGELGEAANLLKKMKRGDYTLTEIKPKLIQEFADVMIYLDLLCKQLDIDVWEAIKITFNNKSEQVGSNVFLTDEGPILMPEGAVYRPVKYRDAVRD